MMEEAYCWLFVSAAAMLLAASLLRLPARLRIALIILILASLSMASVPATEFQLRGLAVIAMA
jgi:hypothetical protein